MRIQKILGMTNLSKKAVYFYIKEDLINPEKNVENGYYDFSEEDLKKLQIITSLRRIGMSIQDIKELFMYPTLTNFFIHRQINNLKCSMDEQIKQLQTAYYLIDKIPANAKPDSLDLSMETLFKMQSNNHTAIEKYFPNADARMIAILIWAAFTDIEASEYHNFLWEKISNELNFQLDHKLIYLKKIVYGLSAEQVYNASVHMFNLSREVIMAEESELKIYEDKLLNNCMEIIEDRKLQEYWKLVYGPVIKPTVSFFESEVDRLFKEYNPKYTNYSENMNVIVKNVLKELEGNPKTMQMLSEALGKEANMGKVDFSDLSSLYSFKGSIFTQIELDKLKELLY